MHASRRKGCAGLVFLIISIIWAVKWFLGALAGLLKLFIVMMLVMLVLALAVGAVVLVVWLQSKLAEAPIPDGRVPPPITQDPRVQSDVPPKPSGEEP